MAVVFFMGDGWYFVGVEGWGSACFRDKFDANQYALGLMHGGVVSGVRLSDGMYIPA